MAKAADDANYLMLFGTFGASDQDLNACNIAAGHQYHLISMFTLNDATVGNVNLYMIRNPWGESSSAYNRDWNANDTDWTTANINQVPGGINPTTSDRNGGIFFMTEADVVTCMDELDIAHYRGTTYSSDWYD